jgi:hypothetical protein
LLSDGHWQAFLNWVKTRSKITEQLNKVAFTIHDGDLERKVVGIEDVYQILKPKCICACHDNLLNKPYEHDRKCCEEMNGEVI